MLVCKEFTKTVGKFTVENISFELPKGCVLGLIGRNGTGKTTLLRSLLGYYQPTAGDAWIDDTARVDNEVAFKKKIAYVLNENPFPPAESLQLIGKLYGSYYEGFSQEKYNVMLDHFGLKGNSTLANCSTGQKIRQQLAFACAYGAALYVMDEPAANLDVTFRDELYEIIRDLTSDGQKMVILSTHSLEELEGIADYILWLRREENVSHTYFYGTTDELKDTFRLVEGSREQLEKLPEEAIVGGSMTEHHSELLVRGLAEGRYASLKEIMYYTEKGEIV